MKFKEIFDRCGQRSKHKSLQHMALELSEEAGEVSKAVNSMRKEEIKSEIGDLILSAIGLYLKVEDDIETLKPLIMRKINV